MTEARKSRLRCAIYTRKSSEEGLEQDFNSIDAQREACAAYIHSQKHEGWKALPTLYDDGGYSGGNLDRPALQQLMADIRAGRVDLVVVYKIDRLTRSLSDFAKMVEVFDASNASFVSVTQHFNTTTSMGRLTLNVLLSFAQFEREVTGERIRDKIAASKQKGMWMGGNVPIGYDVVERKLVVNPEEADLVRHIYARYLYLGDVQMLKRELDRDDYCSKRRTRADGQVSGGQRFFRGALYRMLQNRIYLGEIVHKGQAYPGQHPALIDHATWQAVQEKLEANRMGWKHRSRAQEVSLLAGRVTDGEGRPLTPSHTVKNGKRYRYYIARPEQTEEGRWEPRISVPAHDLEATVLQGLLHWLADIPSLIRDLRLKHRTSQERQTALRNAEALATTLSQAPPREQRPVLHGLIAQVKVGVEQVRIRLQRASVQQLLGMPSAPLMQIDDTDELSADEQSADEPTLDPGDPVVEVKASIRRFGGEMRLVIVEDWAKVEVPKPDPWLVGSVARAQVWLKQLLSGEVDSIPELAKREKVSEGHVSRTLRCAFLAPDIVEAILEGRQPEHMTVRQLVKTMPLSWVEQRQHFGMQSR